MKIDQAELAKKAFNEGVIYGYEYSEADITSKVFPQNDYAKELCREQLKIAFFEDIEEPDYPPTEIEFEEFIESLVFYLYTGKRQAKNIDEAIKLITGKSFWGPLYVWVNGTLHDTYHLPATDAKGNIVGLRF